MLQFTVPGSQPSPQASSAEGDGYVASPRSLLFDPCWVALARPNLQYVASVQLEDTSSQAALDFRQQHRVLVGSRSRAREPSSTGPLEEAVAGWPRHSSRVRLPRE